MKIVFLVVGKTTDGLLDQLISQYVSRIKHYASFEIAVVPELKNTKALSQMQQKEKEGEALLNFFQPSDFVILLDEGGRQYTSEQFATHLQKIGMMGHKRVVFVIGGPYGFSEKVYKTAHEKASLSLMTFPHQLVRLIFVEQLYRAFTILHGEPYHHP
ncbi:MAG: 23S rRNA (pseudouridine(1915)-N(3))-methyltransferase RlmH [Bacteroidaceae bacterium]|nr:23S rRNA (pseudouridine(1915)-N(3))-methyltransferase RlmH [Bacteroidaceae bacterium]